MRREQRKDAEAWHESGMKRIASSIYSLNSQSLFYSCKAPVNLYIG